MVLQPRQQRRFDRLQEKKQAGTIQAGALGRFNDLKAQRRQGETPQMSPPLTTGGIGGAGVPSSQMPTRDRRFNSPRHGARVTTNDLYGYADKHTQGAVDSAFRPFDFDALPQAPSTQDLAAERGRIEDSLYSKYTTGFGDERQQARDALEQNLARRGIAPGSGDLYEREMNRFDDSWNRRYDEARQNAVSQGGQEWQRSFGIGRTGRADALGEQTLDRTFGLGQLGSLYDMINRAQAGDLAYKDLRQRGKLSREQLASSERLARSRLGGGGVPPTFILPPPPPPGLE